MTTHATEDDHSHDDEGGRGEPVAEPGPLLPEDDRTVLTGHHVAAALLEDWRFMFDGLHARFATGDFATGLRLVDGIGTAAEEVDHHPDLDLRYPQVDVRLSSHDVGGVTMRDVRLARTISDVAGKLGVQAHPAELQVVELALDVSDLEAVKPFWAAVLGLEPSDGDEQELTDPAGRLPTLWFQKTGEDRQGEQTPAQRFHLDVRVPPEQAEARVHAAVEAGGTLVSDGRAPAFWVLADAQGNRACITTWLGRG